MKAIYPGSFDPVTYGHIDIMKRGAVIFDEVVVGVTNNPKKKHMFNLEERVGFIRQAMGEVSNVKVEPFNTLLVNFAKAQNAGVILKGLRAVSDFEYELQMSLVNRRLADDIETLFMMAGEEFSFASSTMLKEVASLNGDVSAMAPKFVQDALLEKLDEIGQRK